MKKEKNKILLILLYLLLQWSVFSQENNERVYTGNPGETIILEGNNKISVYTLDLMTDNRTIKHGVYTTVLMYRIPFINVTWENNEKETFLMLSNSIICSLYQATNTNPYVLGFSGGYNRGEAVFHRPRSIRASSTLVENGRPYSTAQINTRLGQAWVEGVEGQGIGEKLFIYPEYLTPQWGCTALHISIGFVSYEKPYLYEENSRPKKLNISVANKFSFTADLIDTPNFQTINLPQTLGINDELIIELLDVYPGTKYEDTCINNIFYDTVTQR